MDLRTAPSPAPGAEPVSGPDLLRLALGQPALALSLAEAVVEQSRDPMDLSYALQARAIVLRDRGESGAAVAVLRAARAKARATRSGQRVADVRATLGTALVMDGRTTAGLRELDAAAEATRGPLAATVWMRRAHVLSFLGRHEQALADLRRALPVIRRSGDRLWEARTLNNRGMLRLSLGEVGGAERDVLRAERIFVDIGQDLEAANALHNRGVVAFLRGDLPTCFSLYAEVARRFAALGTTSADLVADRCEAYLAAGLATDALNLVTGVLSGQSLQARHRSELELIRAMAGLAQGDLDTAADAARAARPQFVAQQRSLGVLRCDLILAQVEYVRGACTPARLGAVRRVATQLGADGAEEAAIAWLLAGRMATELGSADAHECFEAAARARRSTSPQVRATAWLARALDRERAGVGVGVLRACGRGLEELEGQLTGVGDPQMRALVTSHGEELAATALRQVAAASDARALLRWAERWRAIAMARAPVRPPRDPQLADDLAALRATMRSLRQPELPSAAARILSERRHRLERRIRQRALELPATPGAPVRWHVDHLLEALGDRTLVELVEVQGALLAVVAGRGRVRRLTVGDLESAVRATERARFALRQTARGRPADLAAAGRHLQAACLGPVARTLGGDGVVLCAPSRLHHAPWSLCPDLADRPVSASPSAGMWLTATRRAQASPTRWTFVAGPGLPDGDAEVRSLARAHPGATVLRGDRATVEQSLAALDGAAVAHIAAHGRHRADNPMFSCLDLYDGPLTVHDLQHLDAPPHRVVLSACESGVMSPVGADEVLGMAAALLALGAAGVVCAVGPVNDAATRPVMQRVYEALAAGGRPPAQALAFARSEARGDALAEATAASFTVLGA